MELFDVIILGGSYAGLAAGLQLARARRKILVIDAGQRRNRFASHSHGFLTRDGEDAAAIAAIAREQLAAYKTVHWQAEEATAVEKGETGFRVQIKTGTTMEGKRLILATGVTDILPAVPGVAERWGRHIFHCPYCHGYELEQGKIGVLATSPLSMHQALMLPDWGETTLLLNGAFEPDAEQLAQLERRGVTLEREGVERIENKADAVLKRGRVLAFAGLFTASRTEPSSPVAAQLGCEMEETPMGCIVRTDAMKATSVPGVFACGDLARAAGSVSHAVGDGVSAGVAAHHSLISNPL